MDTIAIISTEFRFSINSYYYIAQILFLFPLKLAVRFFAPNTALVTMAGGTEGARDYCSTPEPPVEQPTGPTTGQVGGMIIEANAILHNEIYPALGESRCVVLTNSRGLSKASCVQRQSLQPKTLPRKHPPPPK